MGNKLQEHWDFLIAQVFECRDIIDHIDKIKGGDVELSIDILSGTAHRLEDFERILLDIQHAKEESDH